MSAEVMRAKTELLGWKATRSIKKYIAELKENNWIPK